MMLSFPPPFSIYLILGNEWFFSFCYKAQQIVAPVLELKEY